MVKNEDIPDSVIIKQQQAEINKLKYKLQRKEEAIVAFKKWQGKVAKYKYEYWLNEGLHYLETPPPAKQLTALKATLCNYGNFERHLKRAQSCYDAYLKSLKDLQRESISEN